MKPSSEHSGTGPITGVAVHAALLEVGVDATDEQCAQLARHANLVLEANEKFNLTRITCVEDVLRLHIQDSALALRQVQDAQPGRLLDMGSGPGYPGIVLGVLTGRETVLVDSVRKKAEFLGEAVNALGLNARALWSRVEELPVDLRHSCAVVVARGLTQLPSLVELATPLLSPSGRVIALKARIDENEVQRGVAAARMCGLSSPCRERLSLPGGEVREIISLDRISKPKVPLPRRTGLAQRQPLA